jgi:hypothetical protein
VKKFETLVYASAVFVMSLVSPALAQGADGFYKGKQINIIIYSNAG